MILTARGPEQQAQGVNNTLAYINLALALGGVGQPFAGYGTLTGQGNGQGGREHGQKADQLPGYRRIDDPAARRHVAGVWGVPAASIPGPGRSAVELIDSIGAEGGVRALFVMGSNLVVSAPDASQVEARLKALDFLVVCDFFLSETASLADVVLPSAQWAEEEGTMTNLEGRVILRRRAMMPPEGVRTDLEVIARARGGPRQGTILRVQHRLRCLRRARPRQRRRRRRLLRHHLRTHRVRRRRVLAVPGAGPSRHAASVRGPVPDAERPRALSRGHPSDARRRAGRRASVVSDDGARAGALPVGHADSTCRRARSRLRPNLSRRCIPPRPALRTARTAGSSGSRRVVARPRSR